VRMLSLAMGARAVGARAVGSHQYEQDIVRLNLAEARIEWKGESASPSVRANTAGEDARRFRLFPVTTR